MPRKRQPEARGGRKRPAAKRGATAAAAPAPPPAAAMAPPAEALPPATVAKLLSVSPPLAMHRVADAAISPRTGLIVPGAPTEPVLRVQEIQGNSLAGFNKDYQAFLFVKIQEVEVAKAWLRSLTPRISKLSEVAAFNRLFRALRAQLGAEAAGLSAVWHNVAFSYPAIVALASRQEADQLPDEAFRQGLAKQSEVLGDPPNTAEWVVGGTAETSADVLVIVAADDPADLQQAVDRLTDEIGAARDDSGQPGLGLLHLQRGATLPGDLRGHEQFGFKDGVSQPAVRGLVSDVPQDFLSPRWLDPSESRALRFARPGQRLVWPGQFVFGYPRQQDIDDLNPKPIDPAVPAWAHDGSLVVFRRLRQDVEGFHGFVRDEAARLAGIAGFEGLTALRLGALLIGRWPSGAPLMRAALADDPGLARDDFANNAFSFTRAAPPPPLVPIPGYPGDHFPVSPADASGDVCPYAAHIRKVNPRDDPTEQGGLKDTLTRMVLRRGIPYGAPGDADRGLLFVCYQTSIVSQFTFLQQTWANNVKRPHDTSGFDPAIGQSSGAAPPRARIIDLPGRTGTRATVTLPKDFVIPSGGGYFFSPSISTLRRWSA
jgi:Dyp-type peroxidase family